MSDALEDEEQQEEIIHICEMAGIEGKQQGSKGRNDSNVLQQVDIRYPSIGEEEKAGRRADEGSERAFS